MKGLNVRLTTAALAAVVGLSLAGCGGSGQKSDAEAFARNELSIYVLDGGVSCKEIASTDTETRYSCSADAVVNGTPQQVSVVVQCVTGGRCSRVPS